MFFFSYKETKDTFLSYCDKTVMSNNAQAAFVVDGDEVEYFTKTLRDDNKFRNFKKHLDGLAQNIGIKYFYILFDNGDPENYTYIYSNDMDEEGYTIGKTESKKEYEGAAEVLKTGKSFEHSEPYHGSYGDLYYAYAPIFNSEGKVVAFLGTDIDFVPFQKHIDDFRNRVILSLIFATVFFGLVFFYSIRKVLIRPMKSITENAVSLSEGNLELQFSSDIFNQDNEISKLGNAFKYLSESIKVVTGDIESIMKSVRRGYMERRVQTNDYQGEFEKIISGVNDTMDIVCSHLDSIPEGIAFVSVSDFKTRYSNAWMRSFLDIHGLLECEENITKGITGAIEDEDVKKGIAEFFERKQQDSSILISQPKETYEIKLRTKGGNEERFYSMSLLDVEVYDDSKYVMIILSDITTLVHEKINADMASRAKSDFLSRMSHEIRTPMNAIMGMTKIAEASNDIENMRYCLSTIENSADHLLRIINDILDMSKIEAGKLQLANEPFSIEKMITKICNIIVDKVSEKNIKFNIDFNKEDIHPCYIADELRLSQVILNLLSNAVKFTPENGQITLRVKKIADDNKQSTLLFSISDNGIGLTDEQIKRLFNHFEQADRTTTKQYGGTGLGLAISKNLIEKMNSQILVKSSTGEGSTFAFELKLEKCNFEEIKKASSFGETKDNLNDLSNVSALLADDIKINREIVIKLLQSTQIKIDEAQNGREAVEKFESSPEKYNIIIMDIQMPEMDGLEATQAIRASSAPNAKTIPIIAMTANAFKEDIEKYLASGMNDHLAKPINKDAVIEKIKKYTES